jgi:hypothetical protein
MNIVDKLREWQRGEREWDQEDMVREVLEAFEKVSDLHETVFGDRFLYDVFPNEFQPEPRHD